MTYIYRILIYLTLVCVSTAQAQLAVTVFPPKIVGQKAVVKLAIKNNLSDRVESARAVVFMLDDQGKMVGQSTKWVIGGSRDKAGLATDASRTFNFVVSSPQPWTTTNLTAKVSFSRLILEGDKVADVRRDVTVNSVAR